MEIKMKKNSLTPEQKQKMRRERSFKIYWKVTAIFLAALLFVGVYLIFHKDKEYSETENRMLAQKPVFSLANVASGKFMTDMESYVTDQFFARDWQISLKLFQDSLLGKRESNGVYIGKKNQLMEIPDKKDYPYVEDNLEAIRDFAARQSGVNTVMTLVPNAAYVCDQLLPANAPVRDQGEDIERAKNVVSSSVNYVDVTGTLKSHKEEYIYYRTDHHWTSLGAKYTFEALADSLGIPNPAQSYTVYPVTHDFSGTLSAKSGYNKARDIIDIYVPEGMDTSCVVNYVDEQKKSASIYSSKDLEERDKYEVFFGGNYSRIDISRANAEKKNLLLIKDSYANCFVQFLLPYYRNIIIIDPRYYYDDIDKLVHDNEITDVLFLYNVNTFMEDNSLADVLAAEDGEQ